MKSRIATNFGKAASRYDSHALLQRQIARQLYHMATLAGKVLDIGCGTGYCHELMRSHKQYLELIQLDIALPMCQLAATYASSPPFGMTHTLCGDGEMLPLADHSVDSIFSSLALQWMDNQRAFDEMARILTPDGKIAIATFGSQTLQELKTAFTVIDQHPHTIAFTDADKCEKQLKQAGLSIVTVKQEQKTLYYPSALDLMKSLKAIGANYKPTIQHFYGKGMLQKLEDAYSQHVTELGLPATWDIYYIIAEHHA